MENAYAAVEERRLSAASEPVKNEQGLQPGHSQRRDAPLHHQKIERDNNQQKSIHA